MNDRVDRFARTHLLDRLVDVGQFRAMSDEAGRLEDAGFDHAQNAWNIFGRLALAPMRPRQLFAEMKLQRVQRNLPIVRHDADPYHPRMWSRKLERFFKDGGIAG